MTNAIKILGVLSLAAAAACGSNNNPSTTGGTGNGTTTGGSGSTTGIPAAPALLTHEIDRMGRGAVNTALTAPLNSFAEGDGGSLIEPAAKDYYNQVSDPTQWTGDFQKAFAGSLAVYDSLDGTCGNQILAATDGGSNLATYGTLAAVLADDELYIDTSVKTCKVYLGTELEAIGALDAGSDCGGRTLTENIIDVTYSALAGTQGVTNGVTSKAGLRATSNFPFLGTP